MSSQFFIISFRPKNPSEKRFLHATINISNNPLIAPRTYSFQHLSREKKLKIIAIRLINIYPTV